MRFKVQTLRTLLWLGNALVFGAILLLFVDIFRTWKNGTKQYLPADRITAAADKDGRIQSGSERDREQTLDKYASLFELNVTGKEKPVEVVAEGPKEVSVTVPPIKDKLKVTMAVTSSDEAQRRVKIEYLGEAAATPAPPPDPSTVRSEARLTADFLGEGDTLKAPYDQPPYSAKIVQIASDEVLFSWGGKEEALEVPKVADTPKQPPKQLKEALAEGAEEPAPPAEDVRESKPLDENGWFIGTDELKRLQDEGQAMLEKVELTTVFDKDDRRNFLAIKTVPEGSLLAQRGFESGDVIRSVNSREVMSRYSLQQFFKDNPGLSVYRVEIERRGSKLTKVFRVPR